MPGLPEFETFMSRETHLVVFREGLIAVSEISSAEGLGNGIVNLTTTAMASALGPFGMLFDLAARVGDLTTRGPDKPDLPQVDVNALLTRDEPTAVLHGQVPLWVLQSSGWPRTEWFRPVAIFPRATILEVQVKWTSTVRWRTSHDHVFQTEINFWRIPRLRRRLSRWHFPLE